MQKEMLSLDKCVTGCRWVVNEVGSTSITPIWQENYYRLTEEQWKKERRKHVEDKRFQNIHKYFLVKRADQVLVTESLFVVITFQEILQANSVLFEC